MFTLQLIWPDLDRNNPVVNFLYTNSFHWDVVELDKTTMRANNRYFLSNDFHSCMLFDEVQTEQLKDCVNAIRKKKKRKTPIFNYHPEKERKMETEMTVASRFFHASASVYKPLLSTIRSTSQCLLVMGWAVSASLCRHSNPLVQEEQHLLPSFTMKNDDSDYVEIFKSQNDQW